MDIENHPDAIRVLEWAKGFGGEQDANEHLRRFPPELQPARDICVARGWVERLGASGVFRLTDPGAGILAEHRLAATTPPGENSEPPGPTANAVEALLGDDTQAILKVAGSNESADTRMRQICGIDRQFLGYNSGRWAELLGVKGAAIRKTAFWKHDRKRAIEANSELYGQ